MFDTNTFTTDFYIADSEGSFLAQQRLDNGTFGPFVLVNLSSTDAESRPLTTAGLARLNTHRIAWWGVLLTDHPSRKTFMLIRARYTEGVSIPFGDGVGQTGV